MVWSIGMADNGKKKSQSPPNKANEASNKYAIKSVDTFVIIALCRVSPGRETNSTAVDDDSITDQLAGQLRQEQEPQEPTVNEQSTEQEEQQQQEEQQEEEDEERKCFIIKHITHCSNAIHRVDFTHTMASHQCAIA